MSVFESGGEYLFVIAAILLLNGAALIGAVLFLSRIDNERDEQERDSRERYTFFGEKVR